MGNLGSVPIKTKTNNTSDNVSDNMSDNVIENAIQLAIQTGARKCELIDFITGKIFFDFDQITKRPMLSGSYKKFSDPEYCNKFKMLLSEASIKLLTDFEVKTIMSRIQSGSDLETDKYLIVDLNNIKDLDIQDSSEKENACKQISDFYVKIAHCFSAILFALNPQFIDSNSITHSIKSKYENNIVTSTSKTNTVFDQRLDLFSVKKDKDSNNSVVSLNVCGAPSLSKESFDSLAQLFSDNETFSNVSDEERERVNELIQVYSSFSYDKQYKELAENDLNNDEKSIKRLIETMKFFNYKTQLDKCDDSELYKKNIKISNSASNEIFNQAMKHYKEMLNKMETFSDEFIKHLATLFDVKITNEIMVDVIVSPTLTIDSLDILIRQLRMELVEFYISSEKDFHELILMFDSLAYSTDFESNLNEQNIIKEQLLKDSIDDN
jgi:hypothetical protein